MSEKFVVFDVEHTSDAIRRGSATRSSKKSDTPRAFEVESRVLSENFTAFLDNVRGMLAQVYEHTELFLIDTVEIQAEVSAEGKVGFMGTGLATKGAASLKIVLKRRPLDAPSGEPAPD